MLAMVDKQNPAMLSIIVRKAAKSPGGHQVSEPALDSEKQKHSTLQTPGMGR